MILINATNLMCIDKTKYVRKTMDTRKADKWRVQVAEEEAAVTADTMIIRPVQCHFLDINWQLDFCLRSTNQILSNNLIRII